MSHRYPIAADFFCGAGGLSLGFKAAGYRIAFANDIDPDCRGTYSYNHKRTKFFPGSIEALTAEGIFKDTDLKKGEIDVLIGGPPCQGFSINAPKRDENDARNQLFTQYGRLVLEGLQPRVVLMENVPGMLSLQSGRFVNAIYALFGSAGYRMDHMILCAAHYGIPQERWRLFFIGTRLKDREISFPKPKFSAPVRANFTGGRDLTWLKYIAQNSRGLKQYIAVKEAISDLPPLAVFEGSEEAAYTLPPQSKYQRQLRKDSSIIFNHVAGRLSKQNLERIRHIKPGGSWRDIPHNLLPIGMKRARRSDHTRRYGRIDPDGLSGTIMTKCDPHWGSFFHYEQDRALTVREAARIQSFPDRFRFLGSKVSQYMQVGNAVPPMLAQALAEHIKETLLT
jgi:DNA (cytosine-5)-methyltransferase 1